MMVATTCRVTNYAQPSNVSRDGHLNNNPDNDKARTALVTLSTCTAARLHTVPNVGIYAPAYSSAHALETQASRLFDFVTLQKCTVHTCL